MGWSKKDFRKRRTGYVLGSLDRAMTHTLMLKEEFDTAVGLDTEGDNYLDSLIKMTKIDNHATLAFTLYTVLQLMLRAEQWMQQFAEEAYGSVPDKLERWTKTGEDWRKAQEEPE